MNDKENKNMELWNKVFHTDPNYTKPMPHGAKLTSIDAYYRIRIATELWGPYGRLWGLKNLRWGTCGPENGFDVTLEAVFYCPLSEFEASTDIKFKPDNDSRKKCVTDLITKCLSYLGLCADIYLGKFKDDKYLDKNTPEKKESSDRKKPAPEEHPKRYEQPSNIKRINPDQLDALDQMIADYNIPTKYVDAALKKHWNITSTKDVSVAVYAYVFNYFSFSGQVLRFGWDSEVAKAMLWDKFQAYPYRIDTMTDSIRKTLEKGQDEHENSKAEGGFSIDDLLGDEAETDK